MVNVLLLPELRELLADGDEATLSSVLIDMHAASIAEFSEGLTVEETWQLFDRAPWRGRRRSSNSIPWPSR